MKVRPIFARYILIAVFLGFGIYQAFYRYTDGLYLNALLYVSFFGALAYGFWQKKSWAKILIFVILYVMSAVTVLSIVFSGLAEPGVGIRATLLTITAMIILIVLTRISSQPE